MPHNRASCPVDLQATYRDSAPTRLLSEQNAGSLLYGIALPDVLEGLGQDLDVDCAVGVSGVAGEDELVVIALGGENLGHILIGDDPVMHVIAQGVHVEVVAVADLHPDAQGLGGAVGDEVGMKLPNSTAPPGGGRARPG